MTVAGKDAKQASLALLKDIQSRRGTQRQRAGRGIGLASSYVSTLPGVSPATLKACEERLVYRDEDCIVLGGIKTLPEYIQQNQGINQMPDWMDQGTADRARQQNTSDRQNRRPTLQAGMAVQAFVDGVWEHGEISQDLGNGKYKVVVDNSRVVTLDETYIQPYGPGKDYAPLHHKFGKAPSLMAATPGSILDFEGILTSARKDRDGDRLAPLGAELDERMPLLWQHLPEQPVGRLMRTISQNELAVKTHFAIADIPLGRDAATLVEFGALRLSHGFQPIDFEPITEKDFSEGYVDKANNDDVSGWDVKRYVVMEGSLVSVPSNVDSIITAQSRGKLHTPMVKGWANGIWQSERERRSSVTGGYESHTSHEGPAVNVTVNLDVPNLLRELKGGETVVPASILPRNGKSSPVKGKKAKDDKPDESPPGQSDLLPAPGDVAPPVAPGEEEVEKPDEEEKKPKEDEGPKDVLLTDIRNLVDEAGKADLPKEAKARLKTLSEMIGDVEKQMKEAAKDAKTAAGEQNLAGVIGSMSDLMGGVVEMLSRIKEESTRIQGLDGADEVAETLGKLDDEVDLLVANLSALTDASDPTSIDDQAAPDDVVDNLDPGDTGDMGMMEPDAGDMPQDFQTAPNTPPMRSHRPRRKGMVRVVIRRDNGSIVGRVDVSDEQYAHAQASMEESGAVYVGDFLNPRQIGDFASGGGRLRADEWVTVSLEQKSHRRKDEMAPDMGGGDAGTEGAGMETAGVNQEMLSVKCVDCQKDFAVPKHQSNLPAVCPYCKNNNNTPGRPDELGKTWIHGQVINGSQSRNDSATHKSHDDYDGEIEAHDDDIPGWESAEEAMEQKDGSAPAVTPGTLTCQGCGTTWQSGRLSSGNNCPGCGKPGVAAQQNTAQQTASQPAAPSQGVNQTSPTAPVGQRSFDKSTEGLATKFLAGLFAGKRVSMETLMAIKEATEMALDSEVSDVLAVV